MSDTNASRTWLWVLVGGAAFVIFVLAVFSIVYFTVKDQGGSGYVISGGSGGRIGVVEVEGVIVSPEETVRQLKKFADDDSIKAIIIHLNTPGGGAAASEEIYREVRHIRDDKKKKVVASIETVGASGGYYIASACNKIYADDASIVGSIGVIMEWYNYGDLLHWAKMKEEVIYAGKYKDTGDPTRELTPDERAYLQQMADTMHQQFIEAVASGRGLKVDDVKAIATGRVWTGTQALPLKLIDALGGFEVAVKETAKSVGIQGEPTLVKAQKEKQTLLDLLFGDVSSYVPDRAKLLQKNPGFYYLWR
ncbi:MAG: signal peptide peptidase SppA [Terriglobales bacterium]